MEGTRFVVSISVTLPPAPPCPGGDFDDFPNFVKKTGPTKKPTYIIIINFRDQPYTIDLTYIENVYTIVEVVLKSIQSTK